MQLKSLISSNLTKVSIGDEGSQMTTLSATPVFLSSPPHAA
jgi:hypothetical protein